MGQFTLRPQEDPQDWAGLPSEPLPPESVAQRLAEPIAVADALLTDAAPGVSSISIVVPAVPSGDDGDA
ncbi:hypothetical protein AB1K54_14925 [Microbacterium sp. BWT-B31]|uniref:hypothetical protein n=1 Tax=Microbacterium sp. BWT-B31 TaxID=3232072 RepID=UPI0035293009